MSPIPPEPVLTIVFGLSAAALMVLILPFKVKKIEENLEPFFLVMGAAVVTISGLWSWKLVVEALKAPVMIGSLPIGIFQVVLVVGLLIHFFNVPFCNAMHRSAPILPQPTKPTFILAIANSRPTTKKLPASSQVRNHFGPTDWEAEASHRLRSNTHTIRKRVEGYHTSET
jgi:hypothetical protein